MLRYISGFFGALAGAVTGAISGLFLGAAYYGDYKADTPDWEYNGSAGDGFGAFLCGIVGMGVGVLSGFCRGALTGADQGVVAGLTFPKSLYHHYFDVRNANKKNESRFDSYDSPILCPHRAPTEAPLTDQEIRDFEKSPACSGKLQQDLQFYQEYMDSVPKDDGGNNIPLKRLSRPITLLFDEDKKYRTYSYEYVRKESQYVREKRLTTLEKPVLKNPAIANAQIIGRWPPLIKGIIVEVRKFLRSKKSSYTTELKGIAEYSENRSVPALVSAPPVLTSLKSPLLTPGSEVVSEHPSSPKPRMS